MTAFAARAAAWIALALLALSAVAADVVPTLGAGLADAMLLCAPSDAANVRPHPQAASLRDPAVLRAPRCGVA